MTTLKERESARPRFLQLDALRGLAALSVVLYHYLTRYGTFPGLVHTTTFPYRFEWGWLGVNVFFVISGFVIYMSLTRATTALDFVVSRVIRLYPTYWMGIILTTLFVYVVGLPDWSLTPFEVAANFSMFHFFALIPSVDGAYWSLAEELKFYLLMLFFKSIGQIHRPLVVCGSWLAVASLFAVGMKSFDTGPVRLLCSTGYLLVSGSYCFWFISGIAIYGIWNNHRNWSNYVIAGLNVGYFFLPCDYRIYPAPVTALILLSIFCTVVFARPAWMQNRHLLFLGGISYPLYVLHQNIGYCIIKVGYAMNLSGWVSVALAICVSLTLAWLVQRFVQVSVEKWLRDRYHNWRTNKI